MNHDDLPLAHVRVVDFSNGLAGPLAAMTLGDLGADVVKVETTGRGDLTRDLVPTMFTTVNRNKRSICLNLKHEEGLAVARRLVEECDVLVESFRPGVIDRLGLGPSVLLEADPALIYASVSGFGSTSRDRDRRAVDAVAQAETGMIAANEGREAPFTVVDTATGIALAQGVLAALVRRASTGRGQVVEATLIGTALYLQAVQISDFCETGEVLTTSERARRAPSTGTFATLDGSVYVAAHYEEHWRALAEVIDAPTLIDDPRFLTRPDRVANGGELRRILDARFATRTTREWTDLLSRRGVMAAAIRVHGDVLDDEELVGEGWITRRDGTTAISLPYTFAGETMSVRSAAPELGAHTREVLGELGYDEATIDALVANDAAEAHGSTTPSNRKAAQGESDE